MVIYTLCYGTLSSLLHVKPHFQISQTDFNLGQKTESLGMILHLDYTDGGMLSIK